MSKQYVWLAGSSDVEGGGNERVFSNEKAAYDWLRYKHRECVKDAVRSNEREKKDRAEKLAQYRAEGDEQMVRYLEDPTTAHKWEVGEIEIVMDGLIRFDEGDWTVWSVRRVPVLESWRPE